MVPGDGQAVANAGHHPQPGPALLARVCMIGLLREGGQHTALVALRSPASPGCPGAASGPAPQLQGNAFHRVSPLMSDFINKLIHFALRTN